MDWSRAKSVLIAAFLILNVVLGYQLWLELRERIDSAVDWTSLPPDTLQAMTNKGIRIDAEIPSETPAMRDITYRLQQAPEGRPNDPIALDPQPDTRIVFSQEELQQALSGVIPELDQYRFDNFGGNEETFVLNRMMNGWPMFDVKIQLFYKNQKITSYRQDQIEIVPGEDAQLQKVLPATKAVANLIDQNYLPAGAVIKEIQLGYHGQIIMGSETQVSAPSWRVLLEDGEVFYVQAISGEAAADQEDAAGGQASPAAGGNGSTE